MSLAWMPNAERRLEEAIADGLRLKGVPCRRQVTVPSGTIDILTEDAILEVKIILTRKAMREGFAQLYMYMVEVKPKRNQLILVGLYTEETPKVAKLFMQLGVTVVSLYSPQGHRHFEAMPGSKIGKHKKPLQRLEPLSFSLPFEDINHHQKPLRTVDGIEEISTSMKISPDESILDSLKVPVDSTIYQPDCPLARLRRKEGVTQIEFAEMCGLTPIEIAQYEYGFRNPDIRKMIRMEQVSNLPYDAIHRPWLFMKDHPDFLAEYASHGQVPTSPERS